MLLILGLVAVSVLVVRLNYWRMAPVFWATFVVVLLGLYLLLWNVGGRGAEETLAIATMAALAGAVGPELWGSLQAQLRRERTTSWILGIGVGIFLLANPELLVEVAVLGPVCYGGWIMIRPIAPRSRRGHNRH